MEWRVGYSYGEPSFVAMSVCILCTQELVEGCKFLFLCPNWSLIRSVFSDFIEKLLSTRGDRHYWNIIIVVEIIPPSIG